MENEHQGYAFTKSQRREKRNAMLVRRATGVAMVAIPAGFGWWIGSITGAFAGAVLGAGLSMVTGCFDDLLF